MYCILQSMCLRFNADGAVGSGGVVVVSVVLLMAVAVLAVGVVLSVVLVEQIFWSFFFYSTFVKPGSKLKKLKVVLKYKYTNYNHSYSYSRTLTHYTDIHMGVCIIHRYSSSFWIVFKWVLFFLYIEIKYHQTYSIFVFLLFFCFLFST